MNPAQLAAIEALDNACEWCGEPDGEWQACDGFHCMSCVSECRLCLRVIAEDGE